MGANDVQNLFEAALDRARTRGPVLRIAIAVSGGGDSMALLRLADKWCKAQNLSLHAATVDHGLRPEAAQETQFVAETCEKLGIDHDILHWKHRASGSHATDLQGNLQDRARHARYDLLAQWAQTLNLDAVLLGHTSDDQAETFLMRLARGSGVDGLARMREDWSARDMRWIRPILNAPRAVLRDFLNREGQTWVEDPSNEDRRFSRVRVRQAMSHLEAIGLDRRVLVETAQRMQDARAALNWIAQDAAQRMAQIDAGDVSFAVSPLRQLPDETRHRLLAHGIMYVSSTTYRPRYDSLKELEREVFSGKTRSLQGCLVSLKDERIVIGRELNAIKELNTAPLALWDGRWRLMADRLLAQTYGTGLRVKPLGDGINQCKNWRETGLRRTTLMSTPAFWCDSSLIAAPLAGLGPEKLIKTAPSKEDFISFVLSH